MADVVTPEVRSRMMSGIRGKNTKPELEIRRGLHKLGLRFRLHRAGLPGKPDLVFAKYRAVIFVHGCFWHGHNCNLFRLPSTHPDFWEQKIAANKARDAKTIEQLIAEKWRCLTVWECAMKGSGKLPADLLFRECEKWILGKKKQAQIRGRQLR